MRPTVALITLVASLISAQPQPRPLRAGVMVTSDGKHVLALEGGSLDVGVPVTVVTTGELQEVFSATIAKQLAGSAAMAKHDMVGPFYELEPDGRSPNFPDFAVVIPGRARVVRAGKAVTLRLGDPPRDVRVRSCASLEGLHLTLWAGTPLKSRRLWHQYYYLGYDVEPTCTPADYSDR